MAIGIVRTKFAAVLLGPSGVGLIGTYMAIQRVASTLAGMGISQSGVRDISEARGSGRDARIAETVTVLRRLSLWLGLLGALLIAALAWPISRLTFGDEGHALEIMVLGFSVLLGLISAAQSAILQGFRRIGHMAVAGIFSTVLGAMAAVIWYYFLGVDGIIPAMLTLSVITLSFTWFYARKVDVQLVVLTWPDLILHAKSLLSLGLAFMWNGLLVASVAYAVRMIILKEFDMASVGIYSAAFGISGMAVNFVLGAMGADYFPRLSEASENHPRMVQLVNEQAEIGILLALPLMIGLMIFAPLLVQFLYTDAFMPAVPMIQWFALGCFARVYQWPLGFVMMAKKKGVLFAVAQTMFASCHIGLILYLIAHFELVGVSMAFALNTLVTYSVVYTIVGRLIGFKWSPVAKRLLLFSISAMLIVFMCSHFGSLLWLQGTAILFWLVVIFFCLRGLCLRVGDHPQLASVLARCPAVLRKYLVPSST